MINLDIMRMSKKNLLAIMFRFCVVFDHMLECQSMSVNVSQCQSMSVNVSQCQSMLRTLQKGCKETFSIK